MTAPATRAPAADPLRERMPLSVDAAREALARLAAPRGGWRTPAAALAAALEDDIPALDGPSANVLLRLAGGVEVVAAWGRSRGLVLLAVLLHDRDVVTVGAAQGRSPLDAWAREFAMPGFEAGLVAWAHAWAGDRVRMTIGMAHGVVNGR